MADPSSNNNNDDNTMAPKTNTLVDADEEGVVDTDEVVDVDDDVVGLFVRICCVGLI